MIYRIEITPAALRFLSNLDLRMRKRIKRAIDMLAEAQHPPGAKKLAGTADRWRVRVGDYRVIYDIRDEILTVLVVKVGHRKDVYRNR